MSTEKDKALFQDCIEAWGLPNQMLLLCEECAELQEALLKIVNRGGTDLENLAEEMADVRLMIDEIEYALVLADKVKWYREHKIKRVKAILRGDKLPKERSDEQKAKD